MKRPTHYAPAKLAKPLTILLELAERGTAANRRECLRLAELPLPPRFPTVARGSRQALLRRTALNPCLAAELRRQCLVELLFGLSVGTQVQQALEVRVSRPRRKKTPNPEGRQPSENGEVKPACLMGEAPPDTTPGGGCAGRS